MEGDWIDMTNKEATKEKVLNAARDEFRELGYQKAKINSIAKRAGIQPSLFYYYFKNMEDVVIALFNDLQYQVIDLLLEKEVTDMIVFILAANLCVQRTECCIAENRRFTYETAVVIPNLIRKINMNLEKIWMPYYDTICRQYHIPKTVDYTCGVLADAGERQLIVNMYDNPLKSTLSQKDWKEHADQKVYFCRTLFLRFGAADANFIEGKFQEAQKAAGKDAGKTGVGDLAKSLFQNPPLLVFLLCETGRNIWNFAVLGMTMYYFTYIAQKMSFMSAYILVANILAIVGVYVSRKLSGKISACLAAGSFVTGMDPASASAELVNAIRIGFMAFPGICALAACVLYHFGYKLTQEKVEMYAKEIAERK